MSESYFLRETGSDIKELGPQNIPSAYFFSIKSAYEAQFSILSFEKYLKMVDFCLLASFTVLVLLSTRYYVSRIRLYKNKTLYHISFIVLEDLSL